jgi:menaquinone-dependent protoporphyrinogen oxidase
VAPSILVAYATKHGSTHEVAEWVAAALREHDLDTATAPAASVESLGRYDGVVLGGALYTGRLHADARAFLRRHRNELTRKPCAVFALGPKTLEPDDLGRSRRQLDAALARSPELEPLAVAVFGGVVRPEGLRFPFNRMEASDARDRQAVDAWATLVADRFRYGKPAAEAGDRRTEVQQSHR